MAGGRRDAEVQVFWDYENICFPSNSHAPDALARLHSLALSYGVLTSTRVYMDTTYERSNRKSSLRAQLQMAGWTIVDAPHAGRKNVVDSMIMVDMLVWALKAKAPVIVLITADRDYAYACSALRNHRCKIVLITNPSASPALTQQADKVIDWRTSILCLGVGASADASATTSGSTAGLPSRPDSAFGLPSAASSTPSHGGASTSFAAAAPRYPPSRTASASTSTAHFPLPTLSPAATYPPPDPASKGEAEILDLTLPVARAARKKRTGRDEERKRRKVVEPDEADVADTGGDGEDEDEVLIVSSSSSSPSKARV
ncbi:uncharacterized protein JCM10292_004803 [Rhodotorula paludigena]|uniref:uncharacterized protein n=1 Tax=Rhodotorula paludigena TaxID=86838 RepID=UPI00316F9F3B